MNQEFEQIKKDFRDINNMNHMEHIQVHAGIELSFISLSAGDHYVQNKSQEHIMEINYCKAGRLCWKMTNGNNVYLGPKDFLLHTMRTCADSIINLPNGFYEGITIRIDLQKLTNDPPELLVDSGVTGTLLYEKFCKKGMFTSFAGNEQTENIFQYFYNQPSNLRLSYQRLKVFELLLYLCKVDYISGEHLTEYKSKQVETVRKIHEQLMQNLNQRFTIEELSKQYLMNPTTLKTVFKSVYGMSIAAHMKEHRMNKAAKILIESDRSIAEIALLVGYDSQSKFSTAFKNYFHVLPKEYRRNR